MFHCPKCSSYRISGPRYESGIGERLRYTCNGCGYSMTTSTNDAPDDEAAILLKAEGRP